MMWKADARSYSAVHMMDHVTLAEPLA